MIRFSLGLSLAVLAIIIGVVQFFENKDALVSAHDSLRRTQRQVAEMGQFNQRVEQIKRVVLPQGEDQKSKIERQLGLSGTGLEFKFLSNVKPNDPANQFFYRHEYEVSGIASFFETIKLLNLMETSPGFIINSICFRCNIPGKTEKDNKYPVRIRGYIYVFNPAQV